jgi:hypothetical protein
VSRGAIIPTNEAPKLILTSVAAVAASAASAAADPASAGMVAAAASFRGLQALALNPVEYSQAAHSEPARPASSRGKALARTIRMTARLEQAACP